MARKGRTTEPLATIWHADEPPLRNMSYAWHFGRYDSLDRPAAVVIRRVRQPAVLVGYPPAMSAITHNHFEPCGRPPTTKVGIGFRRRLFLPCQMSAIESKNSLSVL